MLRASATTPYGPLIVVGLSDGNITKLKQGSPIKAELKSFGVDIAGHLVIFHGPTEADMERIMREQGLIGAETRGFTNPKVDQEAEARARHKQILIAMVGLPRSGKSTWAAQSSYPVVCPDQIRLGIRGQRLAVRAEPFVWAITKVMIRALFGSGHNVVVLDATNMTAKCRDEWKSNEWGLFFKHIPTDKTECVHRARTENDTEMIQVIERMAAEFEPLSNNDQLWP